MTDVRELREEIRLLRRENEQLRRDHKSRIATLPREYERILQEMKEPRDTAIPYPA